MESQVLTTAGTNYNVQPENKKNFTFDELENIVKGSYRIHQLSSDQFMVYNCDGRRKGLPLNPHATLIAVVVKGGQIFGDVLLCEKRHIVQ